MTEYECIEVCIQSNYNWDQWLELDEGRRAYLVAYWRVHHAVEANVHDAYNRYSERQARRTRRR